MKNIDVDVTDCPFVILRPSVVLFTEEERNRHRWNHGYRVRVRATREGNHLSMSFRQRSVCLYKLRRRVELVKTKEEFTESSEPLQGQGGGSGVKE